LTGYRFTNEGHINKENSLRGRKAQNQMFMDSINFIEGLIDFYGGLIARKIDF
jgi:hypothetical protein